MPGKKKKTATEKSIASDDAAERERKHAEYLKRVAKTTSNASAASSPASYSPAAASPAAASPGADVDIGSFKDEDGNLLSVLLTHEKKSRDEIKAASIARAAAAQAASIARAAAAREAKAAKRAAAALPAPGTRRSPACCSRFPLLTLI